MASPFDEIDAAGQAAIRNHLGEVVVFYGMLKTDYAEGPDPERKDQVVTAVVSISPRDGLVNESIEGTSKTGAMRAHHRDEIWVDQAEFSTMSWRPRRDDECLVDVRGQQERFVISGVYPNDQGDLQILVNRKPGGRT